MMILICKSSHKKVYWNPSIGSQGRMDAKPEIITLACTVLQTLSILRVEFIRKI